MSRAVDPSVSVIFPTSASAPRSLACRPPLRAGCHRAEPPAQVPRRPPRTGDPRPSPRRGHPTANPARTGGGGLAGSRPSPVERHPTHPGSPAVQASPPRPARPSATPERHPRRPAPRTSGGETMRSAGTGAPDPRHAGPQGGATVALPSYAASAATVTASHGRYVARGRPFRAVGPSCCPAKVTIRDDQTGGAAPHRAHRKCPPGAPSPRTRVLGPPGRHRPRRTTRSRPHPPHRGGCPPAPDLPRQRDRIRPGDHPPRPAREPPAHSFISGFTNGA